MKRRDFIKASSLLAVAVSTSGFIFKEGNDYVGDCESTSDILGPFYRPHSPIRNNLIVNGETGTVVELSGVIKHKDCITAYKNAKVELWHCDNRGEYDNTSKVYKYRGTVFSDSLGRYSFKTILPVPYKYEGIIRPAHFHLMITAPGYQPLITQLYFTGDPYIKDDLSASDESASRRILNVDTVSSGIKRVSYDVSMSPKLKVSLPVLNKLEGVYIDESDTIKKTEFFKNNNALWKKNNIYGTRFEYVGNNSFLIKGAVYKTIECHFEIMTDKSIKLTQTFTARNGDKRSTISYKKI
ncbi:MAG: hypothetical protein NVS3B19_09950 [Ginsengibacter sp.]